MRKLILIAAMSLLASQAYAGGSRSLSLAATNASQQATEQPAAPAAGTPQTTPSPTAAEPPATQTATVTPASTAAGTTTTPAATTAPAATTSAAPAQARTTKPKRRSPSVEARVVRELHRHGIYW